MHYAKKHVIIHFYAPFTDQATEIYICYINPSIYYIIHK
jgi:hypothetical protein